MSIKSDRWIAKRCRLENYTIRPVTKKHKALLLEPVSLAKVMEAGLVSISDIAQYGNNREVVFFAELPQFEKLRQWLEDRYNEHIVGARFEYCAGADHSPQPQDFMAPPVPMIYPFCERADSVIEYRGKKGKGPSYGLSSVGYDIRLGNKFRVAENRKVSGKSNMLDFLSFGDDDNQEHLFRDFEGDALELLPGAFALSVSMEYMSIPNNVGSICMQKSSLARKGCIAFVTPLEPGWRGYITLELFNATDIPMRLYAGMGIMQLMFFESDERCMVSYSDRAGKYMDQPDKPVLSKMG